MSNKSTKGKKSGKSAKAQPSVLGSLPATRHERLGRRDGARASSTAAKPATTTRAAASEPAARTRAAAPKPAKPKATRSTAASRAASAERAAAAQRRAARPKPPPEPTPPPRRVAPPKGPELVTTAIQAAGEIAHIGVAVGGQVLKRAVRRIPRP